MNILGNWLVSALAILITSYLLPGVEINGLVTALLVAVVLGIINAILRPILIFLTLPINLLTLGLFTFVINAFLIILASNLVAGFTVDGFWQALFFGLVLSVINSLLHGLVR